MMLEAFIDVLRFELASGRPDPPDVPGRATPAEIRMAMDLIDEEWKETREAMACVLLSAMTADPPDLDELAEAADGLADLIWVCTAAAVRLGIDLPIVWARVKAANMAKFGPGSRVRGDGKILKPPGWTPPDVRGVIEGQAPIMRVYGHALRHMDRKEGK